MGGACCASVSAPDIVPESSTLNIYTARRANGKLRVHSAISDVLDFDSKRSAKTPLIEATDDQIIAEISRRKLGLKEINEQQDIDISVHSRALLKPLGMVGNEHLAHEVKARDIIIRPTVSEATVHELYDIGALIGQGASAKVFRCKQKTTGESFACKVIQRDSNLNDAQSMSTELEIMKRVRHENVVSMYEVFVSAQCIWLILELVEGGSLRHLLLSMETECSEATTARFVYQILSGVNYLHSIGVVHRDLKLENILVKKLGVSSEDAKKTEVDYDSVQLKIADFGLSALVRVGEKGYHPLSSAKRKGFNHLSEPWGTSEYQAPELLEGAYGPQADIWAVGCIMYEILSGSKAFPRRRGERTFEKQQERVKRREIDFNRSRLMSVSQETREFLLKMLTVSVTKRLSAEEALVQPWLVQHCRDLIPPNAILSPPISSSSTPLGSLVEADRVFPRQQQQLKMPAVPATPLPGPGTDSTILSVGGRVNIFVRPKSQAQSQEVIPLKQVAHMRLDLTRDSTPARYVQPYTQRTNSTTVAKATLTTFPESETALARASSHPSSIVSPQTSTVVSLLSVGTTLATSSSSDSQSQPHVISSSISSSAPVLQHTGIMGRSQEGDTRNRNFVEDITNEDFPDNIMGSTDANVPRPSSALTQVHEKEKRERRRSKDHVSRLHHPVEDATHSSGTNDSQRSLRSPSAQPQSSPRIESPRNLQRHFSHIVCESSDPVVHGTAEGVSSSRRSTIELVGRSTRGPMYPSSPPITVKENSSISKLSPLSSNPL